jgi:hypothetical protein
LLNGLVFIRFFLDNSLLIKFGRNFSFSNLLLSFLFKNFSLKIRAYFVNKKRKNIFPLFVFPFVFKWGTSGVNASLFFGYFRQAQKRVNFFCLAKLITLLELLWNFFSSLFFFFFSSFFFG